MINFYSKKKIAGVDLSAKEKRKTAVCLLQENKARFFLLFKDREIISLLKKEKPDLVLIDACLSKPKKGEALRECDKKLLLMKIRFFPCLIPSMKKLTERGIRLAKKLKREKMKVFETYPGAIQDLLSLPRKKKGREKLQKALSSLGIEGEIKERKLTHDELDALTCALCGVFYFKKRFMFLGRETPRFILPKIKNPARN